MSPTQIPTFKDFEVHSLIGQGAYGSVFLVQKINGLNNGSAFVLKMIDLKRTLEYPERIEMVKNERETLARAKGGPFLQKLLYAFKTSKYLCFVINFGHCGDFFNLLQDRNFSSEHTIFYVAELILGLSFLHEVSPFSSY